MKGLFVTGTDTNVGKTIVSAALMHRFRASCVLRYWKPIQTGIEQDDDTETVRRLGGCVEREVFAEGVRLPMPVSPHLAAERAGVTIDLRGLVPAQPDDTAAWIVEGAGFTHATAILLPGESEPRVVQRTTVQSLAAPVEVVAPVGGELPERPLAEHPNYVTPRGLEMLNTRLRALRDERDRLQDIFGQAFRLIQVAAVVTSFGMIVFAPDDDARSSRMSKLKLRSLCEAADIDLDASTRTAAARLAGFARHRVTAAGAAAAAKQLHAVGDDFRRITVLAFLVLPFAGADAAFDLDRRALLHHEDRRAFGDWFRRADPYAILHAGAGL